MNPKTFSEPLNNENDTLDYEDGGYYSKNVDRKGGQRAMPKRRGVAMEQISGCFFRY